MSDAEERDSPPETARLRIPVLTTGVPYLDQILGGGLPHLSLTIIAGAPGTGKTTLAHQMIFHNGTAERPALYFSVLGEPTVKLLRYQQQFSFFEPERVGREVIYFDLADAVRHGGVSAGLRFITDMVKQHSPGLVAVDSFRAIENLAGETSGELRSFTHDLALLLASWDVTSLLIGEYGEEEMQSKPEFTVADGIFWLSQQELTNSVMRKLQVIKLRGMPVLAGRHAFRITGDGLHLYPHVGAIAAVSEPPAGRAGFGVPGLDEMLHGGIPAGQACLIIGSSGTGKTLLALHFLVSGAEGGDPCVMITFEEQPQVHIQKARSFGWDLEALERRNLLRMLYLRPVDLSVDEVLGEAVRAVSAIGAKRAVINGLSGFELAVAPTERDAFRENLYRLVASLTNAGVTTLLTSEMGDLFGDVRIATGGVSFIADNIILLRYAEIESALRKVLMVIKMRTSDHDKELRQYRITEHGVIVEAPFTQYSGVLSGIPTLRTLTGPQSFTPGLTSDEEALMYVLMSLHEASAEQLAESLGVPEEQAKRILEKLVDTGYIVRAERQGHTAYRAAIMTSGGSPRRPGRRRGQEDR